MGTEEGVDFLGLSDKRLVYLFIWQPSDATWACTLHSENYQRRSKFRRDPDHCSSMPHGDTFTRTDGSHYVHSAILVVIV